MIRDNKLSLPDNWEAVLEQLLCKTPEDHGSGRTYICSPCRAETPEELLRNIKAARIYMYYAYRYMPGVIAAPHAYLPFLLNDNTADERSLALRFGKELLLKSKRLFVCGDRLSGGMLDEITCAADNKLPVYVFNRQVFHELRTCMKYLGMYPEYAHYEDAYRHLALAAGAGELAPYWEAART